MGRELKLHSSIDPNKHKLYESCLIKAIRRGYTDEAIHWGMTLYKLGKAYIAWRRMLIHLSEDIGLANPMMPVIIRSLQNNFYDLRGDDKASYETDGTDRLPFVHAIMLMAESEKSRAVDNAVAVHSTDSRSYEVPSYAIDLHSPLGRRSGRDVKHFFEEAGLINNKSAFPDVWEAEAKEIAIQQEKDAVYEADESPLTEDEKNLLLDAGWVFERENDLYLPDFHYNFWLHGIKDIRLEIKRLKAAACRRKKEKSKSSSARNLDSPNTEVEPGTPAN